MGALISILSNRGYILVNKSLARLYGLDEAVLLGELAAECEYWEAHDGLKDGYFYSTFENVEENTTLARRRQEKAVKTLQDAGVVTVKREGMPAKRYFRLNEDTIVSSLHKTYEQECTERTNKSVQNVQSSLYKTYEQECTNCTINNNKELSNKKSNNITPPDGGGRFKKPTEEEVAAYCKERKNSVDPQAFVDFYTSKGWKVGDQPMKDWKAAVRTWERNRGYRGKEKPRFTQYAQHTDSEFSIDDIALNLDGEDG